MVKSIERVIKKIFQILDLKFLNLISKFASKTTVIPKIQENSSANIIKCFLNNVNGKQKYLINEKN